ncbi:hypothetical protein [Actinoalloteichus hymeniacidonis]|uniref:Uncharacterized protein n=1 Tax=Actinoalloteichus hymeniacidonis TaxID=340345 RepID=A0AAC9HMV1_9PSEU|nr:hypothetical protein [Actinoalloteichus hymeniacidonis]AOS62183.1 hypothetical protein TL08_06805 [Actinoalloteichus hymeniacidonis]MBB5909792.1 hypothetical protein [Actinoalloteichus hymeniacidonis]
MSETTHQTTQINLALAIPGFIAALAAVITVPTFFPAAPLFGLIAVVIGVVGIRGGGGGRRTFIVMTVLGGLGLVLGAAIMLFLIPVGGEIESTVETIVVGRGLG